MQLYVFLPQIQLSLGVVLHGLSAFGLSQATSLAENVAAKWLNDITPAGNEVCVCAHACACSLAQQQ